MAEDGKILKKIAYIVNQYPVASCTFIRREIAALEEMGSPVQRYAIRGWDVPLFDPEDIAEAARTRRILDQGFIGLVRAVIGTACRRPKHLLRAFVEAWRMGRGAPRRIIFHMAYLAEACILREWADKDGIGHLHAHFGTNSATVALLCRRLGGPPYSFTVHGPEEFDHPIELSLNIKIRHAAFAVAVCSFGRSQLWRWADFRDWAKIHVVHCGVDARFLTLDPSPPSTKPRLVNIGRLVEQKGQMILTEAVARLRDQGRVVEVILIGDGPLRNALEQRIRELDLGECIKLSGWLKGEQVQMELISARALVLPSFAEGLPVAIMEALALRRPVLSTYVAGIPELVRPGETGWLVPAGDVDELVAAIGQVLDAPLDQLNRMGQAGAERVAREHDVRTEARKLFDLIEVTS